MRFLLHLLSLFALAISSSSSRPPPAPGRIKILSPHANVILRTDALLVMVDVSGLAVPVMANGTMICVSLGDQRECSSDYDLGSQSAGIMAVVRQWRSPPHTPKHYSVSMLIKKDLLLPPLP